jgi:dihydroxyacetone kinase-like predicted kinase
MGRTFKSVRMGSQEVAQRWLKASRALNKDDQIYGRRLAEMIKKHSSEAFYAIDDPMEAAIFSVLIELLKEIDRRKVEKEDDVDL